MARGSWEQEYCDFFEARRRSLLRTAHGILGSWPGAEDATQQTFVQLYVHWPRIRKGAVDAYARRVLVNTCFGSLRKGRGEVLADAVPDRALPDWAAPATAAEQRLDLTTALLRLSLRDRTVLVLRFLDDLSVAEVAEVLDQPVGTVKSQTSRALARLEAHLADPRPATDLDERNAR